MKATATTVKYNIRRLQLAYTRLNPSKEYTRLIKQYTNLHEFGDPGRNILPEDMFEGRSLPQHAPLIGELLKQTQSNSILDYGCGKAKGYQVGSIQLPDGAVISGLAAYWGIEDIEFYDPAYKPFSEIPSRNFEAVISTDVLEHCPELDVDWILDEIFQLSTKFVFCTLALYPAKKNLPDGTNAHTTIKSVGWWVDKFENVAKELDRSYFLVAIHSPEKQTVIQG